MKVTETITRDCCMQQDLKKVQGCRMFGQFPEFKFCVHCGARHEYYRVTDPAGGSDSEYRKVPEGNVLQTKIVNNLVENIKLD